MQCSGYSSLLVGCVTLAALPLHIIACFRPLTDASLFLVLYGVAAVYFSGVMVSWTATA
jgi:hypothetical protein